MYTKCIILLFISEALSCYSIAQQFITEGILQFEKKVNVHRLFDDKDDTWKTHTPQFKSGQFELRFSQDQTLYYPLGETTQPRTFEDIFLWNTVYTNQRSLTYIAQKEVFDEQYLVQDSLPKIEWKITADRRTIAGFECRKAVGRIFDSLIVIAFYTDEIMTSSGPECFAGLPGMILGVAIPRLHTTWYATGLQLAAIKDGPAMAPPVQGRKVTHTSLVPMLEKKGQKQENHKYRQLFIWQVII